MRRWWLGFVACASCLSPPTAAPPSDASRSSDASHGADDGGAADAFVLPSECDPATKLCTYDCDDANCPLGKDVQCPAGYRCLILCRALTQDFACQGTSVVPIDVHCSGDCEIRCEGPNACRHADVACEGPRCAIVCNGDDACRYGGVNCNAAQCTSIECSGFCACDTGTGVCCGGQTCANGICSSLNGAGPCDCAL